MHFLLSKNKSMVDLVKDLRSENLLRSKKTKEAFLSVDRKDFLPSKEPSLIYGDHAYPIGYAATISAPHMHAYALDLLEPVLKPGNKCLDIGSGSGILCALMMKMVQPTGKVIGVEHIPELVEQSIKNIKKSFKSEYEQGLIKIVESDGRLGYEAEAPYDCIHVGAALKSLDENLLKQLNNNGMMVAPIDNKHGYQELTIIKKDKEGNITKQKAEAVRFVPLVAKEEQWPLSSNKI